MGRLDPKIIEATLGQVSDEASFIKKLLIDLLGWPVDPAVKSVESISYDWSAADLKAAGLEKKVADGQIRQLVLDGCPWGIFLVEFKNPDVFKSGRGMTIPLRQILGGLVPRQRRSARLPSFYREHLLFICTHNYQYFRFVHFKDPGAAFKQPTLASFGWWPGDSTKTVSTYNLPHLQFLSADASVDQWLEQWTSAFDVERVTKRFYEDYKSIHTLFCEKLKGVPNAAERTWLASVLLNRLMFVYFLQKKGFLDGGSESYLEEKLSAAQKSGKNLFYTDFLSLLFFEGFAKPPEKRTAAITRTLGDIRYLNGGLFLRHRIELDAEQAGRTVSLPDSVFVELFKLFASFSWNLNDKPGGQDNEINPDVLGYIVEKYINQKAFGAYYTRPEITGYLCERTIHRLVLDAVNTPAQIIGKSALPVRSFKTVGDLLKKLDNPLATKLLDEALPGMSLLDPACGSGAFLVAAMKTLIDIYAAVFGWIKFSGSAELKSRLRKIESDHRSLDYFIKKRIITDNLYGVDIMEEAVEIARLRLFLALAASANAVEELEPLPNIDFNILRGNSLIGLMHVDHQRAEASNKMGHLGGLLFQQKSYADVLTERNRQLEMYRHFSAYADDLTALRDQISAINEKAQNTLDELLLQDFETLGVKFEQATWDDKKGEEGKPVKRPLTIKDIRALHPFHWAFSFDKVMARGGFDAVITNPPWEIVKPNGKEFFEDHSDLVSKKNMSIHDFLDEQAKLLKDRDIRVAWLSYLGTYPHQSRYFRSSPDYAHQIGVVNGKKVGSDLNLYKLFTERSFRLLRDGGQCGIVIPSGIYTDLGAKALREMLFEKSCLRDLRSFVNERFIFEAVHHAFKFCLVIFGRGDSTISFDATFKTTVSTAIAPEGLGDFLEDRASMMAIPVSVVRVLAPDSISVMEFKTTMDLEISKKVSRFPLIGDHSTGPWGFELVREFDMTNDSDLYKPTPGEGMIPLVEGKTFWQFDSSFSQPRYFVPAGAGRLRVLGRSPDSGQTLNYQRYRVVHRRIASSTNERTLIASVIPRNRFCGDTAQPIKDEVPADRMMYICAVLNSFVADYQIRQRVTAHLDMHFMHTLALPRLEKTDASYASLADRAARLICTTSDFDELANSVGLNPPDHRAGVTDPVERAKLRAELDARVAHLYRLTEEEFAHVLSTFPLVKDEAKQAAMNEFLCLLQSGEAAIFNPELAKPESKAIVDPSQAIKELIAAGESATLEFKSTARFDVKQNKPGPYLERVIVKTIAAFLNTKGGTLVIGVEDNGNVYGLTEDYKLCGNKGRDGFENWLMQTLMKDFGKDAAGQLAVAFHQFGPADESKPGSADVCVVTVQPSPKPRFATENGQEIFYVRTGNATNALKPSELIGYCKERWPDQMPN